MKNDSTLPAWHILSMNEQAASAGVTRRTIELWEKRDPTLEEIAPSIKLGKRRRGRRSDQFLEYLQQRQ